MAAPILARRDEVAVSRLVLDFPHALIIEAERGLDVELLILKLIATEPTDHLDVAPEPDKKSISVQQIRDMIMSVRTYAGRRRVVVIRPANAMTEDAQNALLKILEEPTNGLHFILVAEDGSSLLSTILSRCQSLILSRTSALQDNSLLKSSSVDDQAKQQIRFLAAGRPSLIRQMVSRPALLNKYREIASNAKLVMQQGTYSALIAAQKYATSREDALAMIDILLTMLRFQVKSKGIDPTTKRLIDKLEVTERALSSNANVKLAMLHLVV